MHGNANPRNLEQVINQSYPNGGYIQKICDLDLGQAWSASDNLPILGGNPVGAAAAALTYAAVTSGRGLGISWGNSAATTLKAGWNFQLPLNYMARQGASTSGYLRTVIFADVTMYATTTVQPMVANLHRNASSTAAGTSGYGSAVACDANKSAPLSTAGPGTVRFVWTNPAGAPGDMMGITIGPVSQLGGSDTVVLHGGTVYAICHACTADRSLRDSIRG